ncbi:MAG TPA: hypothetical protein VFW82_03675 [Dyella sp.]|nr:hypothetical protein [Dyella sp.]
MGILSIDLPSESIFPARHHRCVVGLALLATACVLMLAAGRGGDQPQPAALAANSLVHWQDSRHDWLLVADRDAHQLVVYDAATGEPLQRLGRERGLGQVETIAVLGDHLLVQDAAGRPSLLSLPQLQAGTLAAR